MEVRADAKGQKRWSKKPAAKWVDFRRTGNGGNAQVIRPKAGHLRRWVSQELLFALGLASSPSLLSAIAVLCSGLLSHGVAGQDLPVIAVTEMQGSVDSADWQDYKNSKATNFQNMLETQLVKVGRFKILERNRIDDVLAEQLLQGEFSDMGTKLDLGAVDYIVLGSVTKFGSKQRSIEAGKFAVARIITEFGLDLKVVSALDGEIVRAESVEVRIESGSSTRTGGFSTSDNVADPLADVQRRAAKKVAAAIAESVFPIEVLAFRDETSPGCCAYLNYGNAVLSTGDRLKIVMIEESLVDHATGLELGAIEQTVGILEVVEALAKFSKARVVSGGAPAKGQTARIVVESDQTRGAKGPRGQRQRIGREI